MSPDFTSGGGGPGAGYVTGDNFGSFDQRSIYQDIMNLPKAVKDYAPPSR
jgi:hypothetical protein